MQRALCLAGCAALLLAFAGGCPASAPNDGGSSGGGSSSGGGGGLGGGSGGGSGGSGSGGGGSNGGGTGGAGTVVDVAIQNFRFVPNIVLIRAGQTVRWTNRDPVIHTVTSGQPGSSTAGQGFDSGNMAANETFSHTFDTAGEFIYFCIPHQFMATMRNARVSVQP